MRSEAASRREGRFGAPAHISGVALLVVAPGLLVCAAVSWAQDGDAAGQLALCSLLIALAGAWLRRVGKVSGALAPGTVLGAVVAAWLALSVASTLPYLLTGTFDRFDDALFESVSGFTATGSTVLADLGAVDPGVLLWRQMTQWFGGMGIIVLAVAVLPFLGVGGLELIRAEAPGPTSDRLAPRVRGTALRLWLVYAGFTVLAVAALSVAGMSLYDAFAHSLTLVSTGGFSLYDDSIGHFDSVGVELVVQAGMILGAINFALHWRAVQGRPGEYLRSRELRAFAGILVGALALVTLVNLGGGAGLGQVLRESSFNVVSLGTSTGYGNASAANPGGNYVLWAASAQMVLLLLMFFGGMTGSTSGGMKVLRVQVMARVARRELQRSRQPRAVLPVRDGAGTIPEEVVARIVGFVLLYLMITGAGVVAVVALGSDLVTGTGGVVSAMGNMGPALGDAGPTSNFLVYSRPARMVLVLLMLVGRLEVFAIVGMAVVVLRSGTRALRSSRRRGTRPARR